MLRVSGLILLIGLVMSACASAPKTNKEMAGDMLAKVASPRLETFRGERDFENYIETLDLAEDLFWRRDVVSLQEPPIEVPVVEAQDCPEGDPAYHCNR